MSARTLSRREQANLDKLLAQFRKLGDIILRSKQERERLAQEIVQLTCPFRVGDRVYVPRPSKVFHEPHGICEVVEVFAVPSSGDFAEYSSRPTYKFWVRRILKKGELSQRVYMAHWPDHWRDADHKLRRND